MNLSLLLENLKTRFDQKRFKATANKRRHCELLTPKCINVELSLSERETRLREFCSARHVLFLLVILYFWADLYGFGLATSFWSEMYHLFSFSWSLCLRIRACPPALGVYIFHCNSTSGSNHMIAFVCQSVVYVVGC